MNGGILERRRSTSKNKSRHLDHHNHNQPPVIGRTDHHHQGFNKLHSGRLSISKQEYQHQLYCPSPSSALTDISSVTTKIEEMPFKITQKGLRKSSCSDMSKTKETKLQAANRCIGTGSPLLLPLSYMSDTKSSKAKVRSQSEPKQRPKSKWLQKQIKVKRSQSMMEGEKRDEEEKLQYEPWLFKLYRSAKNGKEETNDIHTASVRVTTCNSIYATPSEASPNFPSFQYYHKGNRQISLLVMLFQSF